MSRLLVVVAAALALAGCNRKPEVVEAAPVASAAPAAAPAGQAGQPGPVQGNEQLPPGHPSLDAMPGEPGAAPGQDAGQAMQQMPAHGGAMSSAADAGDVKVPKAAGKDARTVAELFAQREALKDRTVTVRGKVVKFTAGVMGKNWIHLRDGSGTQGKDNDVTVTTQDPAAKGDVVVVQGKVALDQNIGMGTPYPIIIQDAKVTK
jgi:hypothetical protein